MSEVIIESVRAFIMAAILGYLFWIGRRDSIHAQNGWSYIIAGFTLAFFGSVLDITDNFPGLNGYVVIGDTATEAFLEKVGGFLLGPSLILFGFLHWVPLIARNVVQRRLSETALEGARRQNEFIVETAYDAFISMDDQGLITAWNSQAERTFGWSKVEAIGQTLAGLIIPTRHRERHHRGLEHFLRTGEGPVLNQRLEMEAQHRDGHEFPVELTISPLKTGESYIFNALVIDITERRKAEEQAKGPGRPEGRRG